MDKVTNKVDSAASKIMKFFSKKKSEAKFKGAGPGRKLTESAASSSGSQSKKPKDVYVPVKRNDLTDEAKAARDAAMQRIMETNKPSLNISARAIKEQARKELEEQKKVEAESSLKQLTIKSEKKDYAIDGVYFRCPIISDEVLSKPEWKEKIQAFLYEQLEVDAGLTACLIIKNCNTLDKAEDCIETLKKYLLNIINNPTEEKFHKIKMSNRIFCDKVAPTLGSSELLQSAGFQEQTIDNERFLSWSTNFPSELLVHLVEALDLCEVISLELDRNMRVLMPSQIASSVNLPPDFFRVSPEELRKEQLARSAALEEAQMLKTKAMRENDEKRYARNFKFSLIRIRFPDGLYLQGTFRAQENLSNVFDFVMSALHHESAEISLISPEGQKFSNEDADKTLVELRLIPNTTLKFSYEGASKGLTEFLKEELLSLVQSM